MVKRLGCLALLEVPKVLTDFTLTCRKALIPDGQRAIKLERVYSSLIRFSQSSRYFTYMYCYSLAGAWAAKTSGETANQDR